MGGGGGSDDHSGSVFRVGDNVELTRVLAMVSVLVCWVMLLEHFLHKLAHHLQRYPKYHEMMTKVFGELMILGLIGLGIKLLKELTSLNAYSKPMIAFQAADLTVFLVAIALIVQATIVFLRMRRKNIQVDKAELLSTQHLVDFMARTNLPAWFHEFAAMCTLSTPQDRKKLTKADIPEVAQMRILRHYFLKSYGLPELFPFSKYLRQAQDNQISHMIEVEISTWIVLLLISWGLQAVARIAKHYWSEDYPIVVAFLLFSWLSVLLHVAISLYFTWAIDQLLDAAVDSQSRKTSRYLYLDEIAEHEAAVVDRELATDAIAVMERVREHEQRKRGKREHRTRDTGFQLISTICRNLCSVKSKNKSKNQEALANEIVVLEESGKKPRAGEVDGEPVAPVQGPLIHLRWFSRKAWHFVIMSTLMLNAMYVALFCQCIVYQMRSIYHEVGALATCILPLPLVINMLIFQPQILRNFILVSSIFRVDDTAMGEVIDHFTETVQLRASFVQSVHAYLESTHQTVADLESEFESRDPSQTGFLDAEEVRLVLKRFGFKLSYFRFNSVAKLLFDLHGITVNYGQVLKLLEIGSSDEARALANSTLFNGDYHDQHAYLSSSSSFIGVESSEPPQSYVPDAQPPLEPKPRSQKLLLPAKSSVATSLYRMNMERIPTSTIGSDGNSPKSTQYVRM